MAELVIVAHLEIVSRIPRLEAFYSVGRSYMVVNCSFLLIGRVWMLFLLVPQLMSSWKGMNDCAGVFVFPTVAFSSPCVCELKDSEDCLCVWCVCVFTLRSLCLCAHYCELALAVT